MTKKRSNISKIDAISSPSALSESFARATSGLPKVSKAFEYKVSGLSEVSESFARAVSGLPEMSKAFEYNVSDHLSGITKSFEQAASSLSKIDEVFKSVNISTSLSKTVALDTLSKMNIQNFSLQKRKIMHCNYMTYTRIDNLTRIYIILNLLHNLQYIDYSDSGYKNN